MRIKRIESKMNMMSTKVWSWDLLSSDQSWKRMSMDIQTSSLLRFSVRNQWNRVNMARLSTSSRLEMSQPKVL